MSCTNTASAILVDLFGDSVVPGPGASNTPLADLVIGMGQEVRSCPAIVICFQGDTAIQILGG